MGRWSFIYQVINLIPYPYKLILKNIFQLFLRHENIYKYLIYTISFDLIHYRIDLKIGGPVPGISSYLEDICKDREQILDEWCCGSRWHVVRSTDTDGLKDLLEKKIRTEPDNKWEFYFDAVMFKTFLFYLLSN